MATWCIATGQPHDSWRALTRYERRAFVDQVNRIAKQMERNSKSKRRR